MFLLDIFAQNTGLADAVNRLLLMGFYLINIGYVCLNMSDGMHVTGAEQMIETLTYKIGILLLTLGAVHFANIAVLYRLRKKSGYATS